MNKKDLVIKNLLSERKKLLDQGYDPIIVENAFMDFFKLGQSSVGDAMIQLIKKNVLLGVLKYFGMNETSFFAQAIGNAFANVPIKRIGEFFTDCNYFVDETTKAILETFVDKVRISLNQNQVDNLFGQALKEILVEATSKTETYKSLSDKLHTFACPMLKEVTKKIDLSPFKNVGAKSKEVISNVTSKNKDDGNVFSNVLDKASGLLGTTK